MIVELTMAKSKSSIYIAKIFFYLLDDMYSYSTTCIYCNLPTREAVYMLANIRVAKSIGTKLYINIKSAFTHDMDLIHFCHIQVQDKSIASDFG